ncbi:hypothetical protein QQ054_14800 [Oscillatoria amoena NRMC-F 0135]|nr:hypothetical protein [Oscillatoria amoena NRMC-F 0135]
MTREIWGWLKGADLEGVAAIARRNLTDLRRFSSWGLGLEETLGRRAE